MERGALHGLERPGEGGGGDRSDEVELALRATFRRQRVECYPAAWFEADRLDTQSAGKRRVFAFDIDDPRLAAEHDLPEQVRLQQRGFAAADLPDDQTVRIGQRTLLVEVEWVVTERPAVDIPADVRAMGPEAGLGHERIRRLNVGGRRNMPRQTRGPERAHFRPRHSGRVWVNASGCCP